MEELFVALSLGFASGVSPGPLLTLVLTATLERGLGAGVRVACAPIVSDLPIIVACFLVLRSLPESFLAVITILGGAFVIFLGVDTLRRVSRTLEPADAGAKTAVNADLWRAALLNFLNPSPWIFWLGVGVPLTLGLWSRSVVLAAGWGLFFYVGLVGSKIVLAAAIARGRRRLDQRWYRVLLGTCGGLLVVLGALLLWQGGRGVVALGTL